MKRMVHEALVREIVLTEQITDLADYTLRASQKMPGSRIGCKFECIFLQCFRRIVRGIESDCKQYEVAFEAIPKTRLQIAEVVRTAHAEVRQRASRVHKVQGDHLSTKSREGHGFAIL